MFFDIIHVLLYVEKKCVDNNKLIKHTYRPNIFTMSPKLVNVKKDCDTEQKSFLIHVRKKVRN